MRIWSMILCLIGGALGAAGTGLSAWASHRSGDPILTIAAQFLLFHAAPVLLTGLFAQRICLLAAATVLAAGSGLFSGDLTSRVLAGHSLFPMAAPGGGILLIAGWLALGIAGALTRGRGS